MSAEPTGVVCFQSVNECERRCGEFDGYAHRQLNVSDDYIIFAASNLKRSSLDVHACELRILAHECRRESGWIPEEFIDICRLRLLTCLAEGIAAVAMHGTGVSAPSETRMRCRPVARTVVMQVNDVTRFSRSWIAGDAFRAICGLVGMEG